MLFNDHCVPLHIYLFCISGNEFGEPVIAERQIRISDIPFRKDEDEEDDDQSNEDVELVSPEVGSLSC